MLIIICEIVVCVRSGLNLEIPLFLTWLILFLFSKVKKYEWKTVEGYILDGVRAGFQSVMIVAAVGLLIGTWILCGCIPTMIYFGLNIISPKIFLQATVSLHSARSLRSMIWDSASSGFADISDDTMAAGPYPFAAASENSSAADLLSSAVPFPVYLNRPRR